MKPPSDDYFGKWIEASTRTPKVLLVDDEPDIVMTLQAFSHSFHMQLDDARDALEAIQCFESHSYLGILLDLRLPGISGVEVFKRVRQLNRDVPIGIISGAIEQETTRELLQYGRFTHLPKPFQEGLRDLRGWFMALGIKEVPAGVHC